MSSHVRLGKLGRAIGVLSLAGVLALAVVLAATWLEHRIPMELPKPSGPFAVGRTTFHWTDPGHADEFAPVAGTPRELVAWVWYPAAPGSGGTPAEYLPRAWREALARNGGVLMSDFLTRDLSRVRVHSIENVDLSAAQAKYPVVILRAGLAAQVTGYTVLAEDLASRGYVVVGPDAPYRTTVVVFPDGRVVMRPPRYNLELLRESAREDFAARLLQMWTADLRLAIDRLTELNAAPSGRFAGRLDMEHLGVVGHSLGGATAAQFCHLAARCKAGIDLDGALYGPEITDGLQKPFMFVLEDHHKLSGAEVLTVLTRIQSLYEHLPTDSRLKISLAGSNHFSFTDQILLKSPLLLGTMRRVGIVGRLEGARGLAITADYVSTFFDVHLKGADPAALQALASRYPEVRIEQTAAAAD
jgi:dienelactone hydrolase